MCLSSVIPSELHDSTLVNGLTKQPLQEPLVPIGLQFLILHYLYLYHFRHVQDRAVKCDCWLLHACLRVRVTASRRLSWNFIRGVLWQFVKHSDLVKIGQKQWSLYMKMYVCLSISHHDCSYNLHCLWDTSWGCIWCWIKHWAWL